MLTEEDEEDEGVGGEFDEETGDDAEGESILVAGGSGVGVGDGANMLYAGRRMRNQADSGGEDDTGEETTKTLSMLLIEGYSCASNPAM